MSPVLALHGFLAWLRRRPGPVSFSPRPEGTLIWFHCAAPERMLGLAEVLETASERFPDTWILVTLPADQMDRVPPNLPLDVFLLPEPADHPVLFRRFVGHWRPQAVFLCGRLDWIVQSAELARRGVPLIAVAAGWPIEGWLGSRLVRAARRRVLGRYRKILFQDRESWAMARQARLPSAQIERSGQLIPAFAPPPAREADRAGIAELLSGRPTWAAIAPGAAEIETVIEAHRWAMQRSHRLLLILAIGEFPGSVGLAEQLEGAGWIVGLRSRGDEPEGDVQIYLADLPDELGVWYRVAPISLMGGTLMVTAPRGQNPLEAAALGSAVLHGPVVTPYEAEYRRLESAGASRRVASVAEIGTAVDELTAPDRAATMAHAAWQACTSGDEVAQRILELMEQALAETETGVVDGKAGS